MNLSTLFTNTSDKNIIFRIQSDVWGYYTVPQKLNPGQSASYPTGAGETWSINDDKGNNLTNAQLGIVIEGTGEVPFKTVTYNGSWIIQYTYT